MSSNSVYGGGRTVGRGPSGRVRNFGAMLDPKLLAVERLLTEDGNDRLAIERCRAELSKRGYRFHLADIPSARVVAQGAALVTAPSEADVQSEYDELLDWLAEVTN